MADPDIYRYRVVCAVSCSTGWLSWNEAVAALSSKAPLLARRGWCPHGAQRRIVDNAGRVLRVDRQGAV